MKFLILFACVLIWGLNYANLTHRDNIALNKAANQSSTLRIAGYDWVAEFVLDGNANYSESCKCCSLTSGRETAWLEVDLGMIYSIGRIDVFGKPNITDQLQLFDLFIGETIIDSKTSYSVYTNDVTEEEYLLAKGHFVIIVGNVRAQYIRIKDENVLANQMVICEIEVYKACEDFQFEPECNPCYCYESPCNKSTGQCPSGCMSGWQGLSCNESCDEGTFGINCMGKCRCQNPETCDKVTGACTDGNCVFGWKGTYCNISTIISQGKSVTMSSQYWDWEAERAVDGDIRSTPNNCKCCAATKRTNNPWFEIDLGMPFRVAYIIIYGRTDYNVWYQNFKSLRIFAEKHENAKSVPIYSFWENKFFLNVTMDTPVITRYITLKQGGNRLMVICELQLLEGECDDGNFGHLCNNSCYCLGPPCNKETGECPSTKCQPGYQGNTCSEECDDDRFGSECNETCGFCFNSTACDKVEGNCTNCDSGYIGQRCKQSCDNNTFGLNCSYDCGYCKDGVTCDHVTGHCQHGCQPGYVAQFCNDSCDFGKFGDLCASDCGHCANNQTCNITNGHCGDVGCVEGYIEPHCVSKTEEQSGDEIGLSSGSLIAILCSTLLVVLVVLIVAIVLCRRRLQKKRSNQDDCDVDVGVHKHKHTNVKPDIPVPGTRTVQQKEIEFPTDEPENTEYYAFAPRKDDIKIHQIWDYIHKCMENECKQFDDEFMTLKRGLQYECKVATEVQNRSKNRYKEVFAYDENRVKLSVSATDPAGSDYINASFVDGYEKIAKFIASQGPTKEMVDDFWKMIWQQQCSIVVMLTNVYELGVPKCLQYWPIDEKPVTFGNIVVKLLKEEQHADYMIRHLEIDDTDNCQEIKQYHYTAWPDKTTPDTAWSLVDFWRAVTDGSKLVTKPIVIHCSAGLGRTGTFIALDNLYHQAASEGCIRPLQMVETLRKQRVNMVQTKEQYVYMHEAVAEALLFGTHFIKTEQFEDVYNYLVETADREAKSNMEIQFDLIETSLQEDGSTRIDLNKNKNATEQIDESSNKERNPTGKELEKESVYCNVDKPALSEIHQTNDETDKALQRYLKDYKDEQSFLVLAEPKSVDTLTNVIDVIVGSRIQTILQIKDDSKGTISLTENNYLEHIKMEVQEEKETENWTQKDLLLSYTEKDENVTRNIRQFEYSDWNTEENIPNNTKGFSELLDEIQLWQPLISKENPIVFISSDTKRHGLVCVMLNEWMRVKNEDKINIVETVKTMRQQERTFVSKFVQYKFCYDTVKHAVQHSEIYENL